MFKKGFAPLIAIIVIAFVTGTGIIMYQISKTRSKAMIALTSNTSTKLEVNELPVFLENIDSQIKKETNIQTSQPINNQTVCDYSDWQKTISERDEHIKQLEQNITEFQEINKQWVSAENQWKTEKSQLEQQILTWQKGSTNLLKIFQTVILDGIAKGLVDLSYDQSAYNVLLPIAHEPLAQELLLKQLTANAMSVCKGLEGLKNQGIITAVPEYGEKCLLVKDLYESLKE